MALVPLTVIGTLGFWWLGTLPDEAHPEVGRPIFGNIPAPIVALFYVTVAVFLGLTIYLFAQRARNWERGAWEDRSGQLKKRVNRLREALAMKTLLQDPAAGIPHAALYYGFLVLFLGTVTLEIDHLLPNNLKFLEGGFYQGYSFVLDLFAIVYLVGLVWLGIRRYGIKPWRLRSKTKPEDAWILFVLAAIGVTGLAVEAARIAELGRPAFEQWSFLDTASAISSGERPRGRTRFCGLPTLSVSCHSWLSYPTPSCGTWSLRRPTCTCRLGSDRLGRCARSPT